MEIQRKSSGSFHATTLMSIITITFTSSMGPIQKTNYLVLGTAQPNVTMILLAMGILRSVLSLLVIANQTFRFTVLIKCFRYFPTIRRLNQRSNQPQ